MFLTLNYYLLLNAIIFYLLFFFLLTSGWIIRPSKSILKSKRIGFKEASFMERNWKEKLELEKLIGKIQKMVI